MEAVNLNYEEDKNYVLLDVDDYITRTSFGEERYVRLRFRNYLESLVKAKGYEKEIRNLVMVKINNESIWDRLNSTSLTYTRKDFNKFVLDGTMTLIESGMEYMVGGMAH